MTMPAQVVRALVVALISALLVQAMNFEHVVVVVTALSDARKMECTPTINRRPVTSSSASTRTHGENEAPDDSDSSTCTTGASELEVEIIGLIATQQWNTVRSQAVRVGGDASATDNVRLSPWSPLAEDIYRRREFYCNESVDDDARDNFDGCGNL
jgi:hypothetical protein